MMEAKKHIQNPRHIQNTVITSVTKSFFVTLYNPDIFRTIAYSILWYILKPKHILNPAKYLRWSLLLRTLCNYSKFRPPIYSKLLRIQNPDVSTTPEGIIFSLQLLLHYRIRYSLLKLWNIAIQLFSYSLRYDYRALNNTSSEIFDRILDMVYVLNGSKNISAFENVIT